MASQGFCDSCKQMQSADLEWFTCEVCGGYCCEKCGTEHGFICRECEEDGKTPTKDESRNGNNLGASR